MPFRIQTVSASAVKHLPENISDKPSEIILIEDKGQASDDQEKLIEIQFR